MQSGKQGVVALEEGRMCEELKSWLGSISSDCRGGGCGTFSTLMARPCRFESSRYLMASSCSCRRVRHVQLTERLILTTVRCQQHNQPAM